MKITKEHLLALKPCDPSRVEAWAKRHPEGMDLGDCRLLAAEVQADDTGMTWFAEKMGWSRLPNSTSLGAADYLHHAAHAGTLKLPDLAPKEHVFGGVVFVEAGPVRRCKRGEWSLYNSTAMDLGAVCWPMDTDAKWVPLRPVRIESIGGL